MRSAGVVVALVLGGLLSSWDGGGWVRSAGAAANAAAAGTAEKRSWGKAAVRLVVRPVQRVRLAYHFWQLKRAGDAAKVKARAAKIAAVGKRALDKGTFKATELERIFRNALVTPLEAELAALMVAAHDTYADKARAQDRDWIGLDRVVTGLRSAVDGSIGWRLEAVRILREGCLPAETRFSVGREVAQRLGIRLEAVTCPAHQSPYPRGPGPIYPFAASAEAALLLDLWTAQGGFSERSLGALVGEPVATSVDLALQEGVREASSLIERLAPSAALEGSPAATVDLSKATLAINAYRTRVLTAARIAGRVAARLPEDARPPELTPTDYDTVIGERFDQAMHVHAAEAARRDSATPATRAFFQAVAFHLANAIWSAKATAPEGAARHPVATAANAAEGEGGAAAVLAASDSAPAAEATVAAGAGAADPAAGQGRD